MQLEAQEFLELVEGNNKIVFFDIEATGLKGDYNSILVASFAPFKGKPVTVSVERPGNDNHLVREAADILEGYMCWVSYYGKGFDIPMLNTRLLRWGMDPIDKRPHVDLYYTFKNNVLTGRRSQAHMLEFLGCKSHKMTLSPNEWPGAIESGNLKVMKARCESDVVGLRDLYGKGKHLVREITR